VKLNIVNSLQPQAIGDAISALPLLWQLSRMEPLSVYFSCNAVRSLCNFAAISQEPLDGSTLDIQEFAGAAEVQGLHLVQSWFWRLGLAPPEPPFEWPLIPVEPPPSEVTAVFAPFSGGSRSTEAWPPPALFSNQWPKANWLRLLSALRDRGVCLLCSGDDDVGPFRDMGAIVLAGRDLREVAGVLQRAAVVLTIDNGIAWLAQALQPPHVLLQSSRHPRTWTTNPNPNAVNLSSSADAGVVLQVVETLLEGRLPPRHDNSLLDRKIARMALLNAVWLATRGDRGMASGWYRLWRQNASLLQFARIVLEILVAIGQGASPARWRHNCAVFFGRARRDVDGQVPRE
jgi:hypothetical protein